jgi:hypothetical protein
MRPRRVAAPVPGVIAVLAVLLLAGCGSAQLDAAGPRHQAPMVAVSVYIGDAGLLVSPQRLGAGLVQLNVTNQTARTEALVLTGVGSRRALARTGPINPGSTAQLTVQLDRGSYAIAPERGRRALLRVGAPRGGGDSALLQP